MDPIAIGLDAIAHERERYEQAPSAAGAATLAKLHAQVALSQLLEGAVQQAQATLTEVLDLGAQLPQSSHAAVRNDLAICAMHDGRPADALLLLERALQLLPDASGTLQPSMLRSRAQLQLNLCEALLLRGSLDEAVQSATEAVRLSEMALPRHGEREIEGVRKTGGATPRLFTSKWLLPRRGPTQTQPNAPTGCAGALAAPEALLLGWLWRALAQEGQGLFQEALVRPCGAIHQPQPRPEPQPRPSCNPKSTPIPYSPSPSPRPHPHPHSHHYLHQRSYTRAMAVAHVDRHAAGALMAALKKKIALTQLETVAPDQVRARARRGEVARWRRARWRGWGMAATA